MLIHYIIKKIIQEHGVNIIADTRLYNILDDMNAFRYEESSMKFVLRQTILSCGEDLLRSYKHLLPSETTINRCIQKVAKKCGFNEKQVRYIVESLAYGIGWTQGVTPYESSVSFEDRLKVAAYVYHSMGINITQIKGSVSKNRNRMEDMYMTGESEKYDSFKDPHDDNWQVYLKEEQPEYYINSLDWKGMTGIGILCGFNNIRVIDIDNLGCFDKGDYNFWSNPRRYPNNKFDLFVEYCLYLLNLPRDYEWLVRSGSGRGIHIIIRCENVEDLNLKIAAFPAKEELENQEFSLSEMYLQYVKKVDVDFERLELFWSGHIVLPPSISINYDRFQENAPYEPNNYQYQFINSKSLPLDAPAMVKVNDLNNFLLALSGTVQKAWHKYDEKLSKASEFYYLAKLKNTKDSMGGYNCYYDTYDWLKQCTSEEGMNALGVWYIRNERYIEAEQCFRKINSDFAHYNLLTMIKFGYIKGSKQEVLNHFHGCKDSLRIYKDDIENARKFAFGM